MIRRCAGPTLGTSLRVRRQTARTHRMVESLVGVLLITVPILILIGVVGAILFGDRQR